MDYANHYLAGFCAILWKTCGELVRTMKESKAEGAYYDKREESGRLVMTGFWSNRKALRFMTSSGHPVELHDHTT